MKRSIVLPLILAIFFLCSVPLAAIEVGAESALLIDAESGQILYGKNIADTYPPGNLTKLLTTFVALENGNLKENLIVLEGTIKNLPESGRLGLQPGERISLDNALYATVVGNANDAAIVVAENVGGGIEHFVAKMNTTATGFGALQSQFANATGIDDPNQRTSAADLGQILREAVKNNDFLRYLTAASFDIPATNLSDGPYSVASNHQMINGKVKFPVVTGGIVAHTEDALYSSVSYAVYEERKFIVITMKSADSDAMYTDIAAIVNHGVNDWKTITITDKDLLSYLPSSAKRNLVFENPGPVSIPANQSLGDLVPLISIDENQYFRGEIALSLRDNPPYIGQIASIKFFEALPKEGGFPWMFLLKIGIIVILALFVVLIVLRLVLQRKNRKTYPGKKSMAAEPMKRKDAVPKPAPKPKKEKKEKSNRAFYESRRKKKDGQA